MIIKAIEDYESALSVFEVRRGEYHPSTMTVSDNLNSVKRQLAETELVE